MTTMTGSLDFLSQFSEKRLRKEIRNLCDSYTHPWDVMAELCQNAVDAIKRYERRFGQAAKKEHAIEVVIDARDRSLSVWDSGHGFSYERMLDLLAPHGTDKEGEPGMIGEKGVGLTYTIFMADMFEMDSVSIDSRVQGHVKDASSWKYGKTAGPPCFVPTAAEKGTFLPQQTFSKIALKHIEQPISVEEDLFRQSPQVIHYWLCTRTAVGNLDGLFRGTDLPIKVTLVCVDPSGATIKTNPVPRYMLPTEFLNKSDLIKLDDFKARAAAMSDEQKTRRFAGKTLYKMGEVDRPGRKIRYFALFVPSRDVWTDMSKKANICQKDGAGDTVYLIEPGIFVGTRGMPTGISLESPRTGEMSYWPSMFIMLEDDSITFDLGRKSIPGRTKGTLREIARDIFNEFNPYMGTTSAKKPSVTVGTGGTLHQVERSKVFEQLASLPDLGLQGIQYLKHPNEQEAAVVALFHELVGAKMLTGYHCLKTGYKQTYDLWGRYKTQKGAVPTGYDRLADKQGVIDVPIVIEFKYSAEDILEDLENNLKFFTDIDLIVCWDLSETQFAKHMVTVQPLHRDEVLFCGSNFLLEWPGTRNLGDASRKPVLALRKFIQDALAQ